MSHSRRRRKDRKWCTMCDEAMAYENGDGRCKGCLAERAKFKQRKGKA